MDDTLQNKAAIQNMATMQDMAALKSTALGLGKLLDDHNGGKVLVMDMTEINFWTDFFIIATVQSSLSRFK